MTVRRLLGLPVLAVLLAGCGIRPTEVPTDFGPAPSRVRCAPPETAARSTPGTPVQVFLVCGASLVAVDRAVRVPDGVTGPQRRLLLARGLLDRLAEPPTAAEKESGYGTEVRGGTALTGPRPGDPEDTLRLGVSPADLTAYALSQIVCTLSHSAAAEGGGSVVLGGPGGQPPRRYTCTDEVRVRPGGSGPPSSAVAGG
ncbi:hypothetical protein AB0L74_22770 [Streptomyces sp. NPDC052020]|uniref:hypothetical protein n=1 Tax=Streptomyces sp. NPDC052020 TaxID=3155677 RepID=UPI003446FE5E